MASTRNNNTPINYKQEQLRKTQMHDHRMHTQSTIASSTFLPGNGLQSSRLPWDKLSCNGPDTESFLFGINANNLVNPAPVFVPKITTTELSQMHLFEKRPTLMPEPLTVEKYQRPTNF
jgi:hypothetical protein